MKKRRVRNRQHVKPQIRQRISEAVARVYPGCHAEFIGQQSRSALVSRTFGFRVMDGNGRYRSNIVWLNSEYSGSFSDEWVRQIVEASNN